MNTSRSRKTTPLLVAAASATLALTATRSFAQTRAMGIDVSDWQNQATTNNTINWGNVKTNAGKSFVFIRASRGGITGTFNEHVAPDGTGTGHQRYDDPYFIQNINGAKAVGLYSGAYHFDRADLLTTSASNATIISRAQEEADHLLQVAGPWIRPGYLPPVLDLEAGSNLQQAQLSLWATTFADRIYAAKHVMPICYVNTSYAVDEVNSTVAAKMPNLWLARPSGSLSTGDPMGLTTPARYQNPYGVWNPTWDSGNPTVFPSPQPWQFWQNGTASVSGIGGNVDQDAVHGTIEYLKDFLVPVYWTANASGDWATASNWNTDSDAADIVTAAEDPENQYPYHDDITRGGNAPASRLPGNISGSNLTTGADDTVILDNTASAAAYTVTLSSGSYNLRKLYVKRPFNITGGSLTINYDPTTTAAVGSATAPGSTTFSAQFSQAVSMTAGALSVHTLLVDATRTFTFTGGTLTLDTMTLGAGPTPAKLLINGDVTINPFNSAADALIRSSSTTNSATLDLGGATRTLTIPNGSAAVDLTLDLPIVSGSITKAGAGTLQLNKAATLSSTVTVNAGTLISTLNSQLGTSVNLASAGSLHLSGGRSYAIPLTIGGAGAIGVSGTAPGNPGALHALSGNNTWSGNINLTGVGTSGSDPLINQVSAASGATLTLSGIISSASSGALAKSDNGDVVLTGASPNTYTGLTRLYGGRLILEKDAALGTADNHSFMLAASASTIAFRAPAASPAGFTYSTAEVLHTEGSGAPGFAQVDNLSGNNTFAGSIAFTGSGNIGSVGVTAGSLTITGGLYARTGTGSTRTINKTGPGTLVLSGDSSLASSSSSAIALTSSTLNVTAGTVDLRSTSTTSANVPGLSTYAVSPGATLLNTTGTLTGVSVQLTGTNASLQQAASARLHNASLTIADNATAQFSPSNLAPSVLTTLTLSPLAKLDLTTNDLVIDYTGSSPADTIRQKLLSARNNGPWTGTGLTSSSAAIDPQFRTAIAYAESSLFTPEAASLLAGGLPVDTTALLLKYTWYGDANLDGTLNADDFALLDRGFANHLTGWTNGDFNYDNSVTPADYLLIDRVFAQQSGTLSPSLLAQREQQFGADYVSTLLTSIPEPSSLASLFATLPLLTRRRTKS